MECKADLARHHRTLIRELGEYSVVAHFSLKTNNHPPASGHEGTAIMRPSICHQWNALRIGPAQGSSAPDFGNASVFDTENLHDER